MSHKLLAVCVTCVAAGAAAGPAAGALPSWTTYRHDAARTGVDPDSGSPLAPTRAWQTLPLDGKVYGQTLVYGSRVYVATENDSVYALDAATGALVWRKSAGIPVPADKLPCGSITPVVGITSTPVIDPATKRIYAVADTWNGASTKTVQHRLVGFDLADGAPVPGLPLAVDPPGSTATDQLQRAALALHRGRIIAGYGGNDGDCGTYHGWLVAAPEAGGSLLSFQVEPGANGGAIWGSGSGPAVDPAGNIFASTGNGFGAGYGSQESVLKLDAGLNLLDHWAPANWQALDAMDADLGSSAPLLLPAGLVFQIGKEGVGYLLSAATLGGTGASPVFVATVCAGGSFGGGVYFAGAVYVTCTDGLHALSLNTQTRSFGPLSGWKVNPGASGPPIVAGGLVWVAGTNTGLLYGLDPASGATRFSENLVGFNHFTSPSAGGGRLFVARGDLIVGHGDQVTAFTIARPPPPSPTTTIIGASASRSRAGVDVRFTVTVTPGPDAGTVSFTDAGRVIRGCGTVGLGIARGQAVCTTAFRQAGSHPIVAAYSGDPYYAVSKSPTLREVVSAVAHGAPRLSRIRLSARARQLTLTLSEPATLTVIISREISGRRIKGHCRAGARKGKRCSLALRQATLRLRAKQGRQHFKLRMRTLRRGRYTATLSARDASRRRSTRHTVRFKIK